MDEIRNMERWPEKRSQVARWRSTSRPSVMHADFSVTERARKRWWSMLLGCGAGCVQGSRQGSFCEVPRQLWWSLQGVSGSPWAKDKVWSKRGTKSVISENHKAWSTQQTKAWYESETKRGQQKTQSVAKQDRRKGGQRERQGVVSESHKAWSATQTKAWSTTQTKAWL